MTVQQVLNKITQWLVSGSEIERLEGLDDRLLRDMGIRRKDIARRVKGR
jgi:uncharacterized protein YjiS (DUF1127 family)